MNYQVETEHSVDGAEELQRRQRIENVTMKRLDIRHAAEYVGVPLRHASMLGHIVDQVRAKENTSLNGVGTEEHLVRKDETAEQHQKCNKDNSKSYRRKPGGVFDIE